ncbi:MAG TPA: DUF3575 domain-containing protein [Saprospiraceae bacterium]|nr:DUF3575 domain-containing protein [Saprospiraceae bacterium]HMP15331.1 DUF3575 domain-containing protein [Saprospiraceae bacterium]
MKTSFIIVMKAFFAIALLLLLPVLSFCQLEKGTWLISGNATLFTPSIINTTAPAERETYVELNTLAKAGFFLSNRWVVGAQLSGIVNTSSERDNISGGIVLSPFVRYYLNPNHEKRNWFLTADNIISLELGSGNVSLSTDALTLGGGVNHFITPDFALEGFVGARGITTDDVNFALSLGLQFFLRPNVVRAEVTPAVGKGTWMLGGSSASININNSTSDSWNINLAPNVRFFVSDQWAVGAAVGLSFLKLSAFDISAAVISPDIRYYFTPEQSRMLWFATAGANIARTSINGENISSDLKHTIILGGSGGLGFNYFLTRSVALEAQLGINYFETERFNNFNIASSLGLQFFLPSQKR